MATAPQTADRIKAKARAKWNKLTDDDFDAIKTNVVELATRLQARYGLAADEAKKQAEQFMDEASEAASDAYAKASDAAVVAYAKASDVAGDAYARAVDALDGAATRVDQVVKDNAWATVGGALLLGGVIGYLMAVDRRRSYW